MFATEWEKVQGDAHPMIIDWRWKSKEGRLWVCQSVTEEKKGETWHEHLHEVKSQAWWWTIDEGAKPRKHWWSSIILVDQHPNAHPPPQTRKKSERSQEPKGMSRPLNIFSLWMVTSSFLLKPGHERDKSPSFSLFLFSSRSCLIDSLWTTWQAEGRSKEEDEALFRKISSHICQTRSRTLPRFKSWAVCLSSPPYHHCSHTQARVSTRDLNVLTWMWVRGGESLTRNDAK